MATEQAVPAPARFPFDLDFQGTLLRLLCEDEGFAHALRKYLKPSYFEHEVLAWAYDNAVRYAEQYGVMPSVGVLLQLTRSVDPRVRPLYTATIERVAQSSLRDADWIRATVLDFCKRNVFVQAVTESRDLYNAGQVSQAYDAMMTRMEEITQIRWEVADREWLADNFAARDCLRKRGDVLEEAIPTGFGWLDHILNGGLSPGELGIWIAYSKIGKTTMLLQHGVTAARDVGVNVLHVVLEGSRKQVAARYDAAFSGELYGRVRRGEMTEERYRALVRDYDAMRGRLLLQGYTDRWDYSVADLYGLLKEYKLAYGWEPRLVIVDYGDLLAGREKHYRTETEKQRSAFRDLKGLANRGYALWTASQAQRPEKGAEDKAELLQSRQIADAYDKVRVADFLGSLNQTREERRANVMRLYAELYRDNEAGFYTVVCSDRARMQIYEQEGLTSPSDPEARQNPKFGYCAPVQTIGPV